MVAAAARPAERKERLIIWLGAEHFLSEIWACIGHVAPTLLRAKAQTGPVRTNVPTTRAQASDSDCSLQFNKVRFPDV